MGELGFIFHQIRRNPLSLTGIILIFIFALIALLAPILAPVPPGHPDPYWIPRHGFSPIPNPPSSEHIFGTTQGQYDIFHGAIWGARTAFKAALMVIIVTLIIGIVLGSIAGYFGGIVDEIIMRITDIFFAFPFLILAMALAVGLGPGLKTVILACILVLWPPYARLIRGDILAAREEGYVEAAKAVGCSHARIIGRHILPNVIYPTLIMGSLDIGAITLLIAALSFLGVGLPEGYADWGQLTAFSRNWIVGPPGDPLRYWYTVTIPGLFILFFVLGWNLLGDAFRDILDPKLRRR